MNAARPMPFGLTTPIPVITTRRLLAMFRFDAALADRDTRRYQARAKKKKGSPPSLLRNATLIKEEWGTNHDVFLQPLAFCHHIYSLFSREFFLAAKRRKNTAHGASRGIRVGSPRAPKGRQKSFVLDSVGCPFPLPVTAPTFGFLYCTVTENCAGTVAFPPVAARFTVYVPGAVPGSFCGWLPPPPPQLAIMATVINNRNVSGNRFLRSPGTANRKTPPNTPATIPNS